MNIINKYKITESVFFNQLMKTFGNRIVFYCVTGSTARIQNVTSWSDIDIVIVFDLLSIDDLKEVQNIILHSTSDEKIGTTIYSLSDIKQKRIDPKTFNMINNLKIKKYHARIDFINIVELTNITYPEILFMNKVESNKDLHILKREFMKGLEFDERKTYKTLTYLIRSLIFHVNEWTDGYFETWSKAYELGWIEENEVIYPLDIIKNTKDKYKRFDIYKNIYSVIIEKSDLYMC